MEKKKQPCLKSEDRAGLFLWVEKNSLEVAAEIDFHAVDGLFCSQYQASKGVDAEFAFFV